MSGGLGATNREILSGLLRQRRQALDERRELAPIRAIDDLVGELEELHLMGRKRVPDSWDERLLEFGRTLPPGVALGELRSRITIAHLMDRLYQIQDTLLRARTGVPIDNDLGVAS